MQKILHIVEPLATGIYTFLVELTNRQCNDFDVYIAYGSRPLTHKNFKDYFDKRIHWIRVENFQPSIGFKDVKAFFELKYILDEVKPDIIHLHSSKAGFLGRWAYNCSKNKIFYTPHGFSFLMQNNSYLKRLFYWLIEYLSTFRKATIVACGEGEYKEVLKLSKKRGAYVNNGINIHTLKPYIKEKTLIGTAPIVCTSGRISYQKNPTLFNKIAQLLPEIKFIWIGDGELKHELTSPNIEITGWVDRETVLQFTANADFFLLPSLWEGLPLSLLEAMFLKKVCLVSDIIGNQDVIENEKNGFICHTVGEFVQRITQILQNEYDWQNIVNQAYNDVVTLYNNDAMANRYKEIYNSY